MFMSALNAPAPQVRKKRRVSNTKPTSPTTNKVRVDCFLLLCVSLKCYC